MAFLPHEKGTIDVVPFEYYPAGSITVVPGTLLYLNSGKLALATGTTKPQFIAQHNGTCTSGQVIAVEKIDPRTIYETTNQAVFTNVVVGDKVTIHTDGNQVTATESSGVATVVGFDAAAVTATGKKVHVRFE